MNALSFRGVHLLATLLTVASPAAVRAQGPTPTTNAAVVRLIADRSVVAVHGSSNAAVAAIARARSAAGTTLRAGVAKLPAIRPGATRSFLSRQLEFPRVRRAWEGRAPRVASLFADVGVTAPEVFFRVFKREQLLEVWARNRGQGTYTLLSTYPVCKLSGRLGPKRRQGDLQIPEGFYEIDLLNPQSSYHLSMRVNYPNPVDRARGVGGRLGGDIYIHGGCATIGCVPVTDQWIEELYLIAVQARDAGQEMIPVHLFPTRLDDEGLAWLADTYGPGFVDLPFWRNLQAGYLAFERTRTVPAVGYEGRSYTYPAVPAPAATPSVATAAGT